MVRYMFPILKAISIFEDVMCTQFILYAVGCGGGGCVIQVVSVVN